MADEFVKNKNIFIAALDHYYDNGLTYVEAGDGDELWEHKHYKHIIKANGSVWQRVKVERNYVKWIELNQMALICGHTHREKFPKANELPYFNSGCCIFPSYITGLEIADDTITLAGWRIEADEKRYLHIVRRVLAGPEPVSTYHLKK